MASAAYCCFLLLHFRQGAGDFGWAIHAGQRLLAGQDPYDTPLEQYPLTAAFFALPFVRLRPEVAGALFYGVSSALLAFGLTRHGYHRLFVFLAYPYWGGLLAVQWSTLIFASAFFPLLLPATMAKPQLGLPVALTRLSRRGILACVAVALLTLVALPRWPLLCLALWRYRDKDAWFLVLTAMMPQRWFFDAFILWLIPKSRREILFTAGMSWGAGVWRWYHIPHSFVEVGRFTVLFIYLPMLAVILFRQFSREES